MSGRTFLDSNILIYLYDEDSPDKQATAKRIVERHGFGDEVFISTQVLQEFYVVLSRKFSKRIPEEEILLATQALRDLPMVQVDVEMIFKAISLCKAIQVSFWDALIIQAALEAGCSALVSEDLQHGFRIGELTIFNPFLNEPELTKGSFN